MKRIINRRRKLIENNSVWRQNQFKKKKTIKNCFYKVEILIAYKKIARFNDALKMRYEDYDIMVQYVLD